MDASFQQRAEQLAKEFAGEARTAEELNGFMRLMMKSALERMLNSELDVHLGRKGVPAATLASDDPREVAAELVGPTAPESARNKPGKRAPTWSDDISECLRLISPTFEHQSIIRQVGLPRRMRGMTNGSDARQHLLHPEIAAVRKVPLMHGIISLRG